VPRRATVNVTGNGKLDFTNVPKGVRTTAESSGLFKKTEINRQTQMEPAAQGSEE
jgi:hypothetical protein